ncbi:MAG: ribose 5-phosphate isomerase A [Hymenobacter sp.]
MAQEKQVAAAAALRWVRDGMLLGLGTGSTSAQFITQLGAAVQNGLKVQGTATSLASEALARQLGIPLVEPRRGLRFDLAVDGADELDVQLRLIKGGGGALLREKVLETAADYLLVIGDSSKLVPVLGRFPLPLEVVAFALPWVLDAVAALRRGPGGAHGPAGRDRLLLFRPEKPARGLPLRPDSGAGAAGDAAQNHPRRCGARPVSGPGQGGHRGARRRGAGAAARRSSAAGLGFCRAAVESPCATSPRATSRDLKA